MHSQRARKNEINSDARKEAGTKDGISFVADELSVVPRLEDLD